MTATAKIDKKEVLARLDFRAFYGGELPELRGDGDEMNADCPFHDDHGRHFYANAKTGLFNCQRCPAKGDVFDFLRERHGTDFKTAIHELAARVAGSRWAARSAIRSMLLWLGWVNAPGLAGARAMRRKKMASPSVAAESKAKKKNSQPRLSCHPWPRVVKGVVT